MHRDMKFITISYHFCDMSDLIRRLLPLLIESLARRRYIDRIEAISRLKIVLPIFAEVLRILLREVLRNWEAVLSRSSGDPIMLSNCDPISSAPMFRLWISRSSFCVLRRSTSRT